jgi:hypothetical protein
MSFSSKCKSALPGTCTILVTLLIGFFSGGAQLGRPGNEILRQAPTRIKPAPPAQQKEWMQDQMDQLKLQLKSLFDVTGNYCSERPIVSESAESSGRRS